MARELFALVGRMTVEGVSEVEKSLARVDRDARKVTRSFVKLGKRTEALGRTLTRNLTAPIAIAGGAAIKFGADFEQAMTGSLAIMGDVSTEMRKKLETAAREVAKTTKFSAAEAAESYFFLASAGLDAAQSMEALPKVAQFAQAGLFDMATATDLLTDAQSALGLAVEDTVQNMANMDRVSDTLVKANTLANATVQQFSEALTNKAGAALRILNKDVEEGTAVLAVFADQGVKGADAGTQLNIVLRDLQKAAVNNKEVFKKAGVEVFDTTGKMKNMADIVKDLDGLLLDMSDEQRRATLTMLGFTDKSISATMALLGTSDQIKEYELALRDAAGTTGEIADKQLQNFWSQLGLVKDNLIDVGLELWNTLQPALMNGLIPALKESVNKIKSLVNWFSDLENGAKSTAIKIALFVASIGPALLVVGKLIIAVRGITTAFIAARTAALAFTAIMAANPIPAAVIGGMLALGIAVKAASEHFRELKEAQQEWQVLTEDQAKIDAFVDGVGRLQKKLAANAEAVKDSATANKLLGNTVSELQKKAKELGYTIEFDLHTNVNLLSLLANKLRGDVIGAGKAFEDAMKIAKKKAETAVKENQKEKKSNLDLTNNAEDLTEKREAFEARWTRERERQGKDRIELLKLEMAEELATAEKLGADKTKILEYYEEKAFQIVLEKRKKRDELEKELSEKKSAILDRELAQEEEAAYQRGDWANMNREQKIQYMQAWLGAAQETVGAIGELFSQYYQNRAIEIANNRDREIAAINSAKMSNEAKVKAIQNIEKGADEKLKALRREQAKREKKLAIFKAIINTALGVSSALSLPFPLNIVMSAIVGVLGAVQVALIAAQPIPFARGGYVKARPGGIEARIGEGSQDEVVLPMRTGVEALSKQLISQIKKDSASDGPERTPSNRGLMSSEPVASVSGKGGADIHFHIGALIANDFGIKELERRMRGIRVAENQRKGE